MHPSQPGRKSLVVTGSHQKTGVLMRDELIGPAPPAADDRQSAGHVLEDGVRTTLDPVGRRHQHPAVASQELRDHVGSEAELQRPGLGEVFGLRLETVAVGSIAEGDEPEGAWTEIGDKRSVPRR